MEQVKIELAEILLALVKALKVLVVYIIPSVVIAIAAIPDIGTVIQEKPETLLPFIINAVVLAIVSYVSPKVERLQASKLG